MIRTKEELFKELRKSESSELDEIIEYRISEKVIRDLIRDREEDNEYFFEKLNKINKRLENIEKQFKIKDNEIKRLKLQRDNWRKIANKNNKELCSEEKK